jgi:hypothetical protein
MWRLKKRGPWRVILIGLLFLALTALEVWFVLYVAENVH